MYSTTVEGDKLSSSTSTHPCHRFSLAEIQSATKNFDDELVIGQGGFGKVYKGQISIEEADYIVAIKRLDSMSNQGAAEFRAEIEMLSKLRHCNLVSLIGYCDGNQDMILVYKYMPNGTLYHHLHKSDTHLNWMQRMKIALGAARGLDYLHTGVGFKHGIIHRDVKSSNILLDEDWTAMISDFGLSKIGPINQSVSYIDASVKGTFGYLDPEYFYTRRLTMKTDVFAFGVVLFELLSGRLPVDIQHGEEQCSLVRWAQKCFKERKLDQMVDPNMRGTIIPRCLRRFAEIAYQCLISVPKKRPTMTEVVGSLLAIQELQVKYESSANSLGTMGFTWKIHKYFVPTTKQTSVGPTETFPGFPETKESIRISNGDDGGYSDARSINGSGNKYLTDHGTCQEGENNGFKPRSPASNSNNNNNAYNASDEVEDEWIEQYEPGVYITLVRLRDGIIDFKRVRFSRKRFGEHQADTWWSENRNKVYERYNIRESDKSLIAGRRSSESLTPSSQY